MNHLLFVKIKLFFFFRNSLIWIYFCFFHLWSIMENYGPWLKLKTRLTKNTLLSPLKPDNTYVLRHT